MTKKKYQRYSSEFKSLALKQASEDGVTDKEVCEDLGVSERQLRRWRDQFRLDGDEAFPGLHRSQSEEVAELKRKLKRAEQERDFLKDAALVNVDPDFGYRKLTAIQEDLRSLGTGDVPP